MGSDTLWAEMVEGLGDDTELLRAAVVTLAEAAAADQLGAFWESVFSGLLVPWGVESAAVVAAQGGEWRVVAAGGRPFSPPAELVADVLDRGEAKAEGGWWAAPLAAGEGVCEAVVVRLRGPDGRPDPLGRLSRLVPFLSQGRAAVADRLRDRQRLDRLEAVLQIADAWNRTREVEPLLVAMAEAATRLLGADRASIFVWDKRSRTLVGRPALGVAGGELRVADDQGVVGRVVQTGEPLRVDAAREPHQINHAVDSRLGYQTRTLLCVPLRNGAGQVVGAFELINKVEGHFTAEDEQALSELAARASIALENAQDREKLVSASRQITDQAAQQVQLIGESRPIQALRSVIQRVADTDLAVLILGENGTGKEVVAQSIHYLSSRRQNPFVAVNCAAIPETLAESELFGHEKGAFTDAQETRRGKFEWAAEGTLFLDEIGDLSLACQAKLLRVLEEKVLVRVGGSTPIHTDARVLAATNQDLAEMVRQKRFREDLYFRLNVVTLDLPPLRNRREDILLLAEHFLADFCQKARRPVPSFSPAARRRLENHPWPGNVRELRNLMERLAYLNNQPTIGAEDLAFILAPRGTGPDLLEVDRSLSEATARFQIEYIQRAIHQSGGNVSQAASRLGLHRSNLYRKMRQLGMPAPGGTDPEGAGRR